MEYDFPLMIWESKNRLFFDNFHLQKHKVLIDHTPQK